MAAYHEELGMKFLTEDMNHYPSLTKKKVLEEETYFFKLRN